MRLATNLKAVNGLFHLCNMEVQKCSRFDVMTAMDVAPYPGVGDIFKSFVRAEPKLVELQISDLGHRLVPLRWSRFILLLFQRCSCSLKRLSICAIKFYDLQRKRNFTLEALDFLELYFPLDSTVEEFTKIMASLNLHISCPSLRELPLMTSSLTWVPHSEKS